MEGVNLTALHVGDGCTARCTGTATAVKFERSRQFAAPGISTALQNCRKVGQSSPDPLLEGSGNGFSFLNSEF